jgi:hypothetical protein
MRAVSPLIPMHSMSDASVYEACESGALRTGGVVTEWSAQRTAVSPAIVGLVHSCKCHVVLAVIEKVSLPWVLNSISLVLCFFRLEGLMLRLHLLLIFLFFVSNFWSSCLLLQHTYFPVSHYGAQWLWFQNYKNNSVLSSFITFPHSPRMLYSSASPKLPRLGFRGCV